MTWLDKLERRFGFLGIPGLIRIVIGFTALVWALMWLNPNFRFALDLDPARIRHGEVWRLVTYIFLPQTLSLWIILALWFLWFIGEGLERAWGAFRFTLYFLVGMVGNGRRIFLRREIFERHANRVVVLRLCALLSRRNHLHPFYFARQNQVACLGFRCVFAAWVCRELKFLSRCAHCRFRQLFHLLRSGDHSPRATSP